MRGSNGSQLFPILFSPSLAVFQFELTIITMNLIHSVLFTG